MGKCQHLESRVVDERAYVGTVAVHPYTDENPAASGNVTNLERCIQCGAERLANRNGRHAEFAPWGPSAEERRHAEQEAEERRQAAARERELAAARAVGLSVVRVKDDQALIAGPSGRQWADLASLEDAAAQDGPLGEIYRGLLRLVRQAA